MPDRDTNASDSELQRLRERVARLDDAEARARSLFESSPMGIHTYRLESDGRLVFTGANSAADSILGVTNAQFVGKTIEEAFPPLADTEVPTRYRAVCESGEPWRTEQIAYEDNRIQGAFEVHAFRTGTRSMAALFLDITARKRAEHAGHALRDLAQALLAITSLDGALARCLDAVLEATGLDSGGIYLLERTTGALALTMARGFSEDFVRWAGRFEADSVQARMTMAGEPAYVDATETPPAKREPSVKAEGMRALAIVPVRHGGRVLACLNVASHVSTDVSPEDRDTIENIAAQLGSAMVRIHAEEESRALHEQLVHSQKMEAVGRLAGGVAHDFNNLLTGIIGYADVVLQQLDEASPVSADVKEIHATGMRAASLTRQLLTFSRKQVIEPELVQLDQAVQRAQRMLGRIIGEHIDLRVETPGPVWPTLADPVQVDQVLVNLAANARDAMPEGGRLILSVDNVEVDAAMARLVPDGREGRYVRLSVADTGHGMSEDVRRHIFEPFFSTKGVEEGTGLGLATVYGIVKQAGGFINVQSAVDAGTRFEIYLARAERGIRRSTPPQGVTDAPRGRETLLLAEDEPTVRRLARRVLESHGYRVLEAADGVEACAVSDAEGGEIHLLVSDVIMPKLDGRRLYERLRERRPGLRVLFMSGYTGEIISQRGLQAEGIRLLNKPFTPRALLTRVRQLLDQ